MANSRDYKIMEEMVATKLDEIWELAEDNTEGDEYAARYGVLSAKLTLIRLAIESLRSWYHETSNDFDGHPQTIV